VKKAKQHIAPAKEEVPSDPFHELVLKRVSLLSQLRIAWLRKMWADMAGNDSEQFNTHTEVDGYLQNADIPSVESKWLAKEPAMKELSKSVKETEQRLFNQPNSRFTTLTSIFNLSKAETDILHACLAYAIEPNIGRVFAYMQDHSARGYVTEALVARLFGHGQTLLIDSNSPLKLWGIIKESASSAGEPARLECDPFIKNWLLGLDSIDESLVSFSRIQPDKKPLNNWPVKKVADYIDRMAKDGTSIPIRIFVSGAEGSGRRSFAATVCKQLGLQLLTLNADRVPENHWDQVFMHAQRQAFLSNTALGWFGTNMQDKFWPQNIPAFRLQFVIGEVDDFIQPDPQFLDLRIELPVITYEERLALWKQFVPQSAKWPKAELNEMVLSHQSTIGQIIAIGQKMNQTIDEAYEALRANASHRLGKLAQRMSGSFTWDDLVLPEHIKKGLEDFTFEATERIHFWEQPTAQRLFPQGKSLIALFTGSPGTGKTMAAQVIASALKLDLFRIDLSTMVSKYIGETSKNIEQILSRAKQMDVVLFFDEADSLFGKRTEVKDAHDRYANTDTNYLLQAIEEYSGIIILASNKKSNIDSAFTRRFRYIFEFPKPDAQQRLQLWRSIVNELAGKKTTAELDDDLVKLSGLLEITGAQIKLSVLSALFMGRRDKTDIKLAHLLKGTERELIKEGKSIGRHIHQSFNQQV
jgi:hypothetical protein